MVKRLKNRTPALLFTLLLTALWLGPLWLAPGLPNSADGQLHLHRSAALTRALADGILWPRWFPEVYQGLGAPVFHYYSPLFYWLTGALHLLSIPLDLAAKLVITLFFALSAFGTAQWINRLPLIFAPPTAGVAGWAAAAIYLAHPHFFREYYFQGDYPQLIALLWLPVVVRAFTVLYRENSRFAWLAAVLSLALLTLMHNITLLFGALALGWYWLGLAWIDGDWRGWWRGIAAGLLAAGLSAFFWLPALLDTAYVQVRNLNESFFHFAQYFVPLSDLLASPPLLDSRAANPPFPHLLGWASWSIILCCLAYLVSFRLYPLFTSSSPHPVPPSSPHALWLLWSLLFIAFTLALTQPWSAPIWERIFVLRLIQFSGRWLGLAAIGVALLAGILGQMSAAKWQGWVAALLVLTSGLSSAAFLFYQQPFLSIGQISQSDTLRYERSSQAWGTTSGNEFLPQWSNGVNPALATQTMETLTSAGMTWQWQTAMTARLTSPPGGFPDGEITLPVHYFPGWRVWHDGELLQTRPSAEGQLTVEWVEGLAWLDLHWGATDWQWRGQWFSLVSFLVLIGVGGRLSAQPKVEGAPNHKTSWLPVIALFLLLCTTLAMRFANLDWLTQHSPPDRVTGLAHPLAVDLRRAEQPIVTLLGWEMLAGSVAQPGGQLRLRLYWQRSGDHSQPLHSFVHLYTLANQQSWAIAQNQNPGRIPTTGWHPALYYVDDLTLNLSPDLPPVAYTLVAGMSDDQTGRLDVAENDDGLVVLADLQIAPLQAGWRQPLQTQHVAPAMFGSALFLQGYDLVAEPGGPVVRLIWEVRQPIENDLTTFLHLLDSTGQRLAQFDGPPLQGLLPTSQWPVGALLVDRRKLVLPQGLSAGQYTITVGLYDAQSGVRLAVTPEDESRPFYQGDALQISFTIPKAN